MYYEVKVQTELEGKKKKYALLVQALSVEEASIRVNQFFRDAISEFEVVSVAMKAYEGLLVDADSLNEKPKPIFGGDDMLMMDEELSTGGGN
jgi:hypothetical protein